MLLSGQAWLLLCLAYLACLFSWRLGGKTEQSGAAILVGGWTGAAAMALVAPQAAALGAPALDAALLAALCALSWRSHRSWPVLAAGLQLAILAAHTADALRLSGAPGAYENALAALAFAQLVVLSIGVMRRGRGAPVPATRV